MQPKREHVPHKPGESLHCFERCETRFPAQLHVHTDYELTLITRGRGLCVIGDRVRPYRAPDLVLLGGELPHTWQSIGPGPQAALVAQWQPPSNAGLGVELPEGRRLAGLLERCRAGLVFATDTAATVQAAFAELLGASGLRRWHRLAELLETCAADGGQPQSTAVVHQTDPRLAGLLHWLQAHAHEPIGLREAAVHLGLGREAAARFIKRQTGSTCTGLIHRLRVGRACELLAGTEERIAAIAFTVGFGSLAMFNRAFRREVGVTPRAWRRSMAP